MSVSSPRSVCLLSVICFLSVIRLPFRPLLVCPFACRSVCLFMRLSVCLSVSPAFLDSHTSSSAPQLTVTTSYPTTQSNAMQSILGLTGYSSDDINKFLWPVRIGSGVFPNDMPGERDFLTNGSYISAMWCTAAAVQWSAV